MEWAIEFTDEFGEWWDSLDAEEQDRIRDTVELLRQLGPALPHPHCSGIVTSRFPHMRELRIQYQGRPYRVLFAFNPLRTAVLLTGGDKTGNDRWYETFVPIADRLYQEHLNELHREGRI
jgi:hypothetical protein